MFCFYELCFRCLFLCFLVGDVVDGFVIVFVRLEVDLGDVSDVVNVDDVMVIVVEVLFFVLYI